LEDSGSAAALLRLLVIAAERDLERKRAGDLQMELQEAREEKCSQMNQSMPVGGILITASGMRVVY
jgi:hypothetical protein